MRDISTKSLTAYYAIALFIIAGLSLSGHLLMARELRLDKTSASIVNLSGRQRMLSQRIASMAAQYRLGDPAARQQLLDAANALESGHDHLLAEINADRASTADTTQLRSIYAETPDSLNGKLRDYITLARAIAAKPVDDPQLPALSTELFAQARSPLIDQLNQVVSLRQHESELRVARLQRLQTGILITLLLTLLLEALTIFRPMVNRIIRYTASLLTLATTDSLTSVLNRRSFTEGGIRELDRADRAQRPTSLLVIDVDHFKAINDAQGHAAGDKVLIALAETLARGLRTSDLLARIGGEEFSILLPETPLETALQVAERLRRDVAASLAPSEVTVSIGVAQSSAVLKTVSQIMIAADAALYRAKQLGRDCVIAAPHVDLGIQPINMPIDLAPATTR